ncbi:MAG: hypothetical protein NTY96_06345 [Bacteroidetes bacterium]|nr:hypothetical protein [Bacteroidota bacterium]
MFIILSGLLPINMESQDVTFPSQKINLNLPKESLKSQYRIQIMESQADQKERMRKIAKDFTIKYRKNAYIVRKGDFIQLHTGDYSEKKFAKSKLSYLKKNFKKPRIVKSRNDSIIEFLVFETKKPVNNTLANFSANLQMQDNAESSMENHPVDFSGWYDPKYLEANSALNEDYLTVEEKKVYYYLNLVRMNPKLFADTYLSNLKNSTDGYESSLYSELQDLKPLPILKPNRKLFESAQCHATESGELGYVGHDRVKCSEYFIGECCHYGVSDALNIVTSLLVDRWVESLGHRKICLDTYTELGVSIKPHKGYGENSVLDFR